MNDLESLKLLNLPKPPKPPLPPPTPTVDTLLSLIYTNRIRNASRLEMLINKEHLYGYVKQIYSANVNSMSEPDQFMCHKIDLSLLESWPHVHTHSSRSSTTRLISSSHNRSLNINSNFNNVTASINESPTILLMNSSSSETFNILEPIIRNSTFFFINIFLFPILFFSIFLFIFLLCSIVKK